MASFAPPAQLVDIPLSLFGGMNTEVAAPDLPEGLSPDNQDFVFVPGGAFTRPCLKKLLSTGIAGNPEIVYAKNYPLPDGSSMNLFMDSAGKIYSQTPGPGPITYQLRTQVPAGLKAQSASAFGREYIAVSDLIHGQWPPLQFDGTNFDRVTQDGPAVGPTVANIAPAVATIQNTGPGVNYTITSITPTDPVEGNDPRDRGRDFVIYKSLTIVTSAPNALAVGTVISMTGVTPSSFNRTNVRVTAIVDPSTFKIAYNSQSTATGAGGTITVQNPSLTRVHNVVTAITSAPHGFQAGWQVKVLMGNITIGAISAISRDGNGVVTVTLAAAVTIPIGSHIQIIGVTDTSFNGPFPVASVLSGTQFTYQQGGSPANSSGGNVQDVFLGSFFIQSTPDATSFTYRNIGPDDLTNATGTATILGQISPGSHGVVLIYLTRQGALTRTSPPVRFAANGGQQMLLTDLAIGPANVVARLIGMTGAGGDNYFVIPSTPQVAGDVVGTSTLILDNTSTSVVLDFSDSTLFSGIAIDQIGNDLFDQRVLGPALGFYSYASRLMCWGDFNQVENLLNLTLAAGYIPITETAFPGFAANNGSGTAWVNPGNNASTSAYADVTVISPGVSQNLYSQTFGFTNLGTPTRIPVNFQYYLTGGGTGLPGSQRSTMTVQLLKAGTPFGTPQIITLSDDRFGTPGTSAAPLSASLLFPAAGLTASDINDSLFGVLIFLTANGHSTDLFVRAVTVSPTLTPALPMGWSSDGSTSVGGAIVSSALPGIQELYQMTSAGGSNDCMISQPAFQDAFGTAILLPNTRYSVSLYMQHIAVLTGWLVVLLDSPTLGNIASVSIPLIVARAQMRRFDLNADTPAIIPSDTLLRIYLQSVPVGAQVSIGEVALQYTAQPYNNGLARISYVVNPEGFAQTTGNLGSTDDQSPIRCFSLQRNSTLLKTAEGTHLFQQNASEPNQWVVDNLSRSVGACSIRAGDPGKFGTGDAAEDWDITVNQNGWYIFGGGDFFKISQEMSAQPTGRSPFDPRITWDDVDWSRQHLIWTKNDIHERRFYCGAPIVGQTDLVLFVLDYRELNTVLEIASGDPIKISMTGKQAATDHTRKWSRWNVAANCADILIQNGNARQMTFAGGTRNGNAYGNLYTLDPALLTDDDYGQMFPYYVTYFFINHEMEQALGIGPNRKLIRKISGFITGVGYVSIVPLVNSLWNPLPATTVRLLKADTDRSNSMNDDLEWTTGIRGDRIAFRIQVQPTPGTTDVQLKIQKLIVGMCADPLAKRRSSDL